MIIFCDPVSVEKIRTHSAKVISLPNKSGIYKWWCEKKLFETFINQLNCYSASPVSIKSILGYIEKTIINGSECYCFYVGKANKSLSNRIKSLHIGKMGKKNPCSGKAIHGSTLRQSINALKNGAHTYDENYVDEVLNSCFVQWAEVNIVDIDENEKNEINSYIRILNRDDCIPLADKSMKDYRETISAALKNARTK